MTHHLDTQLVQAGHPEITASGTPVNIPVVRGSSLLVPTAADRERLWARRHAGENIPAYGIHGLDTHRALESALCTLEGGHRAWLTPSGLSAISLTLLALLSPGDHALLSDSIYNQVRQSDLRLFQRLGIELEYFAPQPEVLETTIRPNTRLLFLESPGSLLNEVLDLPALTHIARQRNIPVAVDNTWGSGYLLKPLTLGADISVLASTKYLGGHSDLLQGAIVCANPALDKRLNDTHESLGLSVGPDDVWLVLRGLRTLAVRLAQHQRHALRVADTLQQHTAVRRVFYPALPDDAGHALWQRDFQGANGLLSFELQNADMAQAHAFIDALALFRIGASWGGVESLALAVDPARLALHSHWRNLAGQGPVIRLHVGLENPDDLNADLLQAFAAIRS